MTDISDPLVHDENDIEVSERKSYAAGVPAVLVSLRHGFEQMGPVRTARTLTKLNQQHGFDCPGCAWPETPGHRKRAEFCENGAKLSPRKPPLAPSTPVSSPAILYRNCSHAPTTGSVARAG